MQVQLKLVKRGLPLKWKYSGWGTVHQVQGKMIQPPTCMLIIDHKLEGWVANADYKAVSCARFIDQIMCPHL